MVFRWLGRRAVEIDDVELDRRLADLRRALSCAPPGRGGIGPDDAAGRRPGHPGASLVAIAGTCAGDDSAADAAGPDADPVALQVVASRQAAGRRGGAAHVRALTAAPPLHRLPAAAVVLVVLAVLSAIAGGFYWYRGAGQPAEPPPLTPPVKVRVGVLPLVDVAAFYRSVDQGYFRKVGLDVQVVTVASGPEAIRGLETGVLDVAFSSYPGMFLAQATRAADLKIIAPAYIAKPGHLMLVGTPDRTFTKPEQSAHKRIAVTARGSISDLLAISGLRRVGGDPSTVTWVPMDMRAMVPAMQRGEIDGAVVAEPFVTTAGEAGAVQLVDLGLDLNFEISMSGWVVPARSLAARPAVVEAFQRALTRGVTDVQDRDVRERIFQQYLGIDAETAREVRVGSYPAHLDLGDLQRVAGLMVEQKMLAGPLDVTPMLLPPGSGS
ncbi:ABC transporter substrate-binding protein [Amycolatopsis sp. NPDC051128]|uniref:ABC transporter substrate-binding protein n=1 Tax=Amycolatopsis sp. NPDC051128 TaxID=3155412 RepID=UPI00341A84C7